MIEFIEPLVQQMHTSNYGNRSLSQTIMKEIRANNLYQLVAETILSTLDYYLHKDREVPLTALAGILTNKVCKVAKVTPNIGTQGLVSAGINILDWCAKIDIIAPRLRLTTDLKQGLIKDQWVIESVNNSFNYQPMHKQLICPTLGYQEWTKPYLYNNGKKITSIVRKMDRYKIKHFYYYDKMPSVYQMLNRLGKVKWRINKHIYSLINQSPDKSIIPPIINDEEKKKAIYLMNRNRDKALKKTAQSFKSSVSYYNSKGIAYNEGNLRRKANKYAVRWETQISENLKKVIGSWSKHFDYQQILKYATQWIDKDLNFTYNLDSRGRVYAIQTYLSPQASDLAKALLEYAEPKPVSTYDLFIHIANSAGEDKGSFEDRVKWVQDNYNELLLIGEDPWFNFNLIDVNSKLFSNGLIKEKKTGWQFLAACNALYDLHIWKANGNNQDDWLCPIPIGLDATSSGVQILTALGRDDKAAQYVNLTKSPNGKVQDFYQYIGSAFCLELRKLIKDLDDNSKVNRKPSDTLRQLALLDPSDKIWRKLTKRQDMTYSYSATSEGMIDMIYEDRKDHSHPLTEQLTMADCEILGPLNHKVCEKMLVQSAKLMNFMRDGIQYHQGGAMITWTLPNGFTAFQVKDKTRECGLEGYINDTKISVKVHVLQNKPNKMMHKFAIAPDMVHSLDAWLLQEIVINMPTEANVSVLHDQFSTDSEYVQDLQRVAKDAYLKISDRNTFKSICSSAFGIDRELPKAGLWNPSSLTEAEFIIC